MFAPDMIKPAIYLAIITAVIGAATMGASAIKQSGYDERRAEELIEFKDQIDAINAEHKDKLEAAIHEANFYRQQAILLQDVKPIVLTKIKEKIINENHNCNTISGMSELLNQSIKRFEL